MTQQFTVSQSVKDDVVILRPNAGIDAYVVSSLRDAIIESAEKGQTKIIIDLVNVDQINSTALGVIVGRLRQVRTQGGDIALIHLNERIKNIFEMMGANKVFPIFPDLESALKYYQSKK